MFECLHLGGCWMGLFAFGLLMCGVTCTWMDNGLRYLNLGGRLNSAWLPPRFLSFMITAMLQYGTG